MENLVITNTTEIIDVVETFYTNTWNHIVHIVTHIWNIYKHIVKLVDSITLTERSSITNTYDLTGITKGITQLNYFDESTNKFICWIASYWPVDISYAWEIKTLIFWISWTWSSATLNQLYSNSKELDLWSVSRGWQTVCLKTNANTLLLLNVSTSWTGFNDKYLITINISNWVITRTNNPIPFWYSFMLSFIENDDISKGIFWYIKTISIIWWWFCKIIWTSLTYTWLNWTYTLIKGKLENTAYLISNDFKTYKKVDINWNIDSSDSSISGVPNWLDSWWSSANLNVISCQTKHISQGNDLFNAIIIWFKNWMIILKQNDDLSLTYIESMTDIKSWNINYWYWRWQWIFIRNVNDEKLYFIDRNTLKFQSFEKSFLLTNEKSLPSVISSTWSWSFKLSTTSGMQTFYRYLLDTPLNWKSVSNSDSGKLFIGYSCNSTSVWYYSYVFWTIDINNEFEDWYQKSIEYIEDFSWFYFETYSQITSDSSLTYEYSLDWTTWKSLTPYKYIFTPWGTKLYIRNNYFKSTDKSIVWLQKWYKINFF